MRERFKKQENNLLIEYRKYRDLDVGYIWKVSSETVVS